MRYAFHISALIVFLASTGFVPSVEQEKSPTDLDRQLLEQLDEFDEQLGGDAAADVGKSDAAGPNSEAAGDSGTPSIDQELLDKLDEGEDIPLGPDSPADLSNLARMPTPSTRIRRKIRIVERLLQARSAQPRTQELQGEIVHDLEELLKQLQRQMQQQAASGSDSPKPQQQGGRSKFRTCPIDKQRRSRVRRNQNDPQLTAKTALADRSRPRSIWPS